MHYVFYNHYTCLGQYQEAIDELNSIERTILNPLRRGEVEPHTTFALFHYFIGQCYRAQRNFPMAEHHFFEAQQESVMRIQSILNPEDKSSAKSKKTTSSNSKKTVSGLSKKAKSGNSYLGIIDQRAVGIGYDVTYNNVFSARVLGAGLSWVALHEGRLIKAAHLLSTAKTLLAGTGLTSLMRFMDFKFAVVQRRRAEFGSPEYWKAMNDLTEIADEFDRRHDKFGKIRCARELVRGYLDSAEFGGQDKDQNLRQAKVWLNTLNREKTSRSEVRFALQQSRYLFVTGDISEAIKVHANALLQAKDGDIALESRIDLANMSALLHFSQNNYEKGRDRIEKELRSTLLEFHVSDERRHIDPVLEAECYLLLAQAYDELGDGNAAQKYMGKWDLLSTFVENRYLHHLAKKIRQDMETPIFHRDSSISFEGKPVTEHINEYSKWLRDRVDQKYPGANDSRLARIFRLRPSTVLRQRRKGLLPQRLKRG